MKYCSYCGTQMPSNGAFCGGCGRRADASTPPQQTYQTMTQTQTDYSTYSTSSVPPTVKEFVEKPEFLKTCPDKNVRMLGLISLIVSLASVLLIVIGAFVGLGRNMVTLPVVRLVGFDDELDEAFDEIRDTSDREIEKSAERMQEYMNFSNRDASRMERSMKNLVKNQSLWNVSGYIFTMCRINRDDMGQSYAFSAMMVLAIPAVIVLAFILAAVFALLGALGRNTGWSGAALVVSALVMPLLSGILMTILAVGALVAQIILNKKIDREYLYALSAGRA